MHSLRACCASLNTGKQLLGFYQVATRVADVFGVPMPDAVAKLLSTFELFNINIAGLGLPLQCIGLGAFEQQLAFTMLAPVVIATVLVLGFLIHHACRGRGYRTALLAALPWFLTLTFMVFPMVSRCAPAPPHTPNCSKKAQTSAVLRFARSHARLSTTAVPFCVRIMLSCAAAAGTSMPRALRGRASFCTPLASRSCTFSCYCVRAVPSWTSGPRRSPRRSDFSFVTSRKSSSGGNFLRRGRRFDRNAEHGTFVSMI